MSSQSTQRLSNPCLKAFIKASWKVGLVLYEQFCGFETLTSMASDSAHSQKFGKVFLGKLPFAEQCRHLFGSSYFQEG